MEAEELFVNRTEVIKILGRVVCRHLDIKLFKFMHRFVFDLSNMSQWVVDTFSQHCKASGKPYIEAIQLQASIQPYSREAALHVDIPRGEAVGKSRVSHAAAILVQKQRNFEELL